MFLKYLYITIDALFILSTFIINYIFIKNALIEKKKNMCLSRKVLLYPTILLLFISSITLCCQIAQIYYVGGNESDHHTTNFVTNMPYGSQFAVLVLILMARLYTIFKGTAYALSRVTIIIFTAWYSFGMVCFVMMTIMAFINVQIYELLLPILSALVYLTNVSLSFAFVYKLVIVNKYIKSTKEYNRMLHTITKNTILCLTSIVFSTFVTVLFQIWGYKNDHVWIYIFAVFDVYSNYLSIVLQYTYFTKWYIILCHCCHARCNQICHKMLKDDAEIAMAKMHMQNVCSSSNISIQTKKSETETERTETEKTVTM
eukprot:313513_1